MATLRFADERWGTRFGPLEIAPDVRREPPPSSRPAPGWHRPAFPAWGAGQSVRT
ncbi:MAG: hypothetical protein ACR2JP_03580 [Acidimicrobiia bacterium]